jgi:hypothetical protein
MIGMLFVGGLLLVWIGLLCWDYWRLRSGKDGGHF